MDSNPQVGIDGHILRRWSAALSLTALGGGGALWLAHEGYSLTAGLLLSILTAVGAWAGFHFRDWHREEDRMAEDLGLAPPSTARKTAGPLHGLAKSGNPVRPTAAALGDSFRLQLEMLRTALDLTGVALLWPDSSGAALRLRGLSSLRTDLRPGPYPVGSGITGILEKDRDEVAMAPVGANFSGLPYYRGRGRTGGLFAIRIPVDGEGRGGILCVDRETTLPWNPLEVETLRMAARRLAFDVAMGRRFLDMHRERGLYQRVSIGLRELTEGLGLESTIDAALKAVRTVIAPDFFALALAEDNAYRVLHAEGPRAEKLLSRAFALEEGLVGQSLRYDCSLPEGAEYLGASPVFGPWTLPADLRSLLVLPLRKEKSAPLGALVLAARKPGVFTRLHRELLELIAKQVAIRIDLALAHEQINRLATTDGLTGLANHRAFQQAFRTMLQRARRNSTSLSLLLCDVDHFKRVNDTFGHPFGDTVLKAVAGALAGSVREIDLAARYGGEEFALLLEDSKREGGRKMAERARRAVEALELDHEGQRVSVTMSLGLAVFPDDGKEIPTLIQRSDQALYQAKRQGRNRTVAWTAKMEGEDGEKAGGGVQQA
jgi:diguanylate cyclase (GGDEF)-like protein